MNKLLLANTSALVASVGLNVVFNLADYLSLYSLEAGLFVGLHHRDLTKLLVPQYFLLSLPAHACPHLLVLCVRDFREVFSAIHVLQIK